MGASKTSGQGTGKSNIQKKLHKQKKWWMLSAAVAATGLVSGVTGASAEAQTLTWDPSLSAGVNGGSGLWDLTTSDWWNGSADQAWVQNDSALFQGTGGTVTFAAPIVANQVTFNPTGGAYNLISTNIANTLTLSGASAGLINSAGANTIATRVIGIGSVNTVNAGVLTLSNTSTNGVNAFTGGSFTVSTGATLRASVANNANAINGAAINLNGSTLSLNVTASAGTGGLFGRLFPGQSGNLDNIGFTNTAAATNVATSVGPVYNEGTANRAGDFAGKVNILNAGTYTFGLNSDDGARLFVDGVLAVNNDTGSGKGVGTVLTGPGITLSAGLHDIRIQYINVGGSGSFTLSSSTTVTTATLFLPEVSSGAFVALPNAEQMNNNVSVAAGTTSGIDFGTNTAFVGVFLAPTSGTGLTLGASSTLNVTGLAGKQLGAASTAFSGNVTINATPDVYLGLTSDGGVAGRLVHQGNGQLILDSFAGVNTLTTGTVLEMQGGRLHVFGGTSATSNPLGNASVLLDGGGMILDTRGGAPTFANNITVTTNATIQDYNDTLTTTLGTAANTLTVSNGATLTLDAITGTQSGTGNAPGAVLQVNSLVSGGGSIVVTSSAFGATTFPGTVFFNNGNNSFAGPVTVNSGILQGGGSAAAFITPFGSNTVTFNNTNSVAASQLNLRANGTGSNGTVFVGGPSATTAQNLIFNGTNAITFDVNNNGANTGNTLTLGTLSFTGSTINVTGGNGYGVAFGGTTGVSNNLTLNPTSGNLTLGGFNDFGANRSLTKSGTGTVTINQSAISLGGPVSVTAGTLNLTAANAVGVAATTVNVTGGSSLTLAATGAVNSGVINDTASNINYNAVGALGGANSTINTTATAYGNGFLFLNSALGNAGTHVSMGTATTLIGGTGTFAGLTRATSTNFTDGNLLLAGGTGTNFAVILDEKNAGVNNSIANLGTNADLWFGLNANVTNETVTLGTTPGTAAFKGITGDFGSATRIFGGTVTAASDFYIQAFSNLNAANRLQFDADIVAANPVNVLIQNGNAGLADTVLITRTNPNISSNVTYVIGNGGNLILLGNSAFGSAAGVIVQSGGILDPSTGGTQTAGLGLGAINVNTTVQGGGQLLLNDSFNVANTNIAITLNQNSVTNFSGTSSVFALLTSGPAALGNTNVTTALHASPGSIARLGASEIIGAYSANGAGTVDTISGAVGVFGPDSIFEITGSTSQANLTSLNASTAPGFAGPMNGTNYTAYLTNDAANRTFGSSAATNITQTIVVGANGAGFAASSGFTFTINANVDDTSNGLVVFGAGSNTIDGLSKFGSLVFNGSFSSPANTTLFTGGSVIFNGQVNGGQGLTFGDVVFQGTTTINTQLTANSLTFSPIYGSSQLTLSNGTNGGFLITGTNGINVFGSAPTSSAFIRFDPTLSAEIISGTGASVVTLGQYSKADLNFDEPAGFSATNRINVLQNFVIGGNATNSVHADGHKFAIFRNNGTATLGVNLNNVTIDGGILSIDQRSGTNLTDVRANLAVTTNNATLAVFTSTQGFGVTNINPSTADGITRIVNIGQPATFSVSGQSGTNNVRASGTAAAPSGNSIRVFGTVAQGVEIDTQNGTLDFVADPANGLKPVLNGVVDVTKVPVGGDSFIRVFAGSDGSANNLTGSGRFILGSNVASVGGDDLILFVDKSTTATPNVNTMPVEIDITKPNDSGLVYVGSTAAASNNAGVTGIGYFQATGTNGGIHVANNSTLSLSIFGETQAVVNSGTAATALVDLILDGPANVKNASGAAANILLNNIVENSGTNPTYLNITGANTVKFNKPNVTFTNTAGNTLFISAGTFAASNSANVQTFGGTAGGGTATILGSVTAAQISISNPITIFNPASYSLSAANNIGGTGQFVIAQPGVFGFTQNGASATATVYFGNSAPGFNGGTALVSTAINNQLLAGTLTPAGNTNGIIVGNRGQVGFIFPTNPAGNTTRTVINQIFTINGNTPQGANVGVFALNADTTNTTGLALLDYANIQLANGSGFSDDYQTGQNGNLIRANFNLQAGGSAFTVQNDTFDLLNVGLYGGTAATLNLGNNNATAGGVVNVRGSIATGVTINLAQNAGLIFPDAADPLVTSQAMNGIVTAQFNRTTAQTLTIVKGHDGSGFAGSGQFFVGGTAVASLQGQVDTVVSGTTLTNVIAPQVNFVASGTAATATLSSQRANGTNLSGTVLFSNVHLQNNAAATLAANNNTALAIGTLTVEGVGQLNNSSSSTLISVGNIVDNGGGQTLNVTGSSTTLVNGTVNFAPNSVINVKGTGVNTLQFNGGAVSNATINVTTPGFVTVAGTTAAIANLITGPVNLSGTGGLALIVAENAGPTPLINTYNGQVNILGGGGATQADGLLQVRDFTSATNGVGGVGVFTNVHLANNSSLNFGLQPLPVATPRDQIVIDLNLDGASGFLSSNADGLSPEFVRNLTATNGAGVLTVYANTTPGLPNSGTVPLGAKSINFVGSLSPNVTVLNGETPAGGINLTSNTNVGSAFTLNGGTFQTGSFGSNTGTTTLTASATPGTSGTFLVTAGTFNAQRSADATVTYQGGTLNFTAPQNLQAFNIGGGTSAAAYTATAANSITANTIGIAANGTLTGNAGGTLSAGLLLNNGTFNDLNANANFTAVAGGGTFNANANATLAPVTFAQGNLNVAAGVTLNANGGTYNVTSAAVAAGAAINLAASSFTASSGVLNNGTLNHTAGAANLGVLTGTGNLVASSPAPLTVTSFTQNNVTINNAATLAVTPAITYASHATNSVSGALTIAPTGSLDLANHDLLVTTANTSEAAVRQYLANGYNGGAWNGAGGVRSSVAAADANGLHALGYSSDPNNGVPAGQVLVRYTLAGDATLDGVVDIADFGKLSFNFGKSGVSWDGGDFTYDGVVDIADFGKLSVNFGKNINTSPAAGGGASGSARAASSKAASAAPAATASAATLTSGGSAAASASGTGASLSVNAATGDVQITFNGIAPRGYEVDSASGQLNTFDQYDTPTAGPLMALADGTTPPNDATRKHNSYWVVISHDGDPAQLAEGFNPSYSPQSPIPVTGTLDLGNIYKHLGAAGDLTFRYVDASGANFSNPVTYSGVPEPTGLALAGLGAAGLLARRRRRRAVGQG